MNILFSLLPLIAHDGHHEVASGGIIHWIGLSHPLFLHFPIVFITATGVAEWMFYQSQRPFYEHAARFCIIMSAISVVPAVLSGFAFSYEVPYEGIMSDYLWWHQAFGLETAGLTFVTWYLKAKNYKALYITALVLLILLVAVTGLIGGSLTFGDMYLKTTS